MLLIFNNIKDKYIFDSMIDFSNLELINSNLISFGIDMGLTGNIWKKYIIYTFIYNENPYTKAIERRNSNDELVAAESDMRFFYSLYNKDISKLGEASDLKFKNTSVSSYLSSLIDEIYDKTLVCL